MEICQICTYKLLRKDPAYEWANLLVGSIYAIGRSHRGRLVDLQADRLLLLSLGAMRDFASITAVKAFAGVLLLVGWVVCIRTAFVSLGALGLLLNVLVLGTLVWMLKGLCD